MKKIQKFLHHLFVPKKGNNYRAKALHHDMLSIYLLVALAFTMFFRFSQTNSSDVLGFATDISNQKLFELTNQERQKQGLPALTYNNKLSKAAELKAQDMFAKNYWAHFDPEGKTSPWTFILSTGYQYEFAGENLAKNFLFSEGVVDAWMNSPTHRENLLRKDYSEIGFATVNGILNGEETTLVVQMFGKPIIAQAEQPNEAAEIKEQKPAIQPVKSVEETYNKTEPLVLAKYNQKPASFLPTYFRFNMLFFVFLFLVLAVDYIVATKLNVARVRGKNLVHLMFIGFIIIGTALATKGAIF